MNQKKLRGLYREEKLQVRRRCGRKRAQAHACSGLRQCPLELGLRLRHVSHGRFRVLAVFGDYTG
ncbi:hypothetical protein [Aminobacter aminovorans]|uniref:Transposase n=1 Tax=Aminobacter aminovorans TaxID=83263 RepID=A0AAC8YVU5_AMIAI|nr:hypothetical protein [Aminobacter aminovorans]AMS44959.1 Transposase [Aminobacter aminovorans]MBB3709790.1 putative transposase [Aminobacter aminovorans]